MVAEHASKAAFEDRSLVERARLGDTEAFGELIEQHRDKMKRWAERMTGDPHMADDIVQDALIRAFMRLGTLADTSRFLPWFHRILRNQSNMRLRRGGPHRNEQPFTSIMNAAGGGSAVDWEDLDSILFHMGRRTADSAASAQDPTASLLRKEWYESIHALIHCLSAKEREIFKAYFFHQLSPEEIAAMHRMTTGSIYTYIYRSRQKLRKEISLSVSLGLLPEKGRCEVPSDKIIPMPERPLQASVLTTFVSSIGQILDAIGDRREMADLMGLSGFAFRMKISDHTTFADGIYLFDWKLTLQSFMAELGYEVTLLCGQLADAPKPLLGAVERFPIVLPIEASVLPFIRKYVDLGKPVLYFDTLAVKPFVHEWSVIHGYDDERRLLYLTDRMLPNGKTISYDDVTGNPVRYLAGIDGMLNDRPGTGSTKEKELRKQAERVVRFAVDYARNGCDYRPKTSYLTYASGLAAYDRWMSHLRSEYIVPNRYGLGQLAAVYAETKRCASQYLRRVPFEGEVMRLTLLASEAYEQTAEALEQLSAYVPFVRTSELLRPEQREACAVLLEAAKSFETAAVAYLEKAIAKMERRDDAGHD